MATTPFSLTRQPNLAIVAVDRKTAFGFAALLLFC
jgi:hypothetical protein